MPMELFYCENIECRVQLYHGSSHDSAKKLQNCPGPGCGRMGRNKGKA